VDKGRSGHFWTAVSACAGAVAALVALVAYLWPHSSAPSSASAAASTSRTVAPAPDRSATPAAVATSSASAAVLAQSDVRIDDNNISVDVGTLPLTVEQEVGGSFWYYEGNLHAGTGAELAVWSQGSTPTAAACGDLLRTEPVNTVPVHKGQRFCMDAYSPRRIAVGQVLSYDGNVAQIRITVWDALMD
jgi:hypothetical protein